MRGRSHHWAPRDHLALTEGQSVDLAGRFATAAASIAVTRAGAQTSMPVRDDVHRVLADAS